MPHDGWETKFKAQQTHFLDSWSCCMLQGALHYSHHTEPGSIQPSLGGTPLLIHTLHQYPVLWSSLAYADALHTCSV